VLDCFAPLATTGIPSVAEEPKDAWQSRLQGLPGILLRMRLSRREISAGEKYVLQ
jgi:hypothetical protein